MSQIIEMCEDHGQALPCSECQKINVVEPPIPVVERIPHETKGRRRRKTAWDRITPAKQVFINEVLSGQSAGKAAQAIGIHPDDLAKATKRGTNIVQDPKVYMALQERLNQMYPDLSKKVAQKVKFLLDQPIKTEKDMPGITVTEFLKLSEYLAKINGWEAVKKTAHLRASFRFPGTEEK